MATPRTPRLCAVGDFFFFFFFCPLPRPVSRRAQMSHRGGCGWVLRQMSFFRQRLLHGHMPPGPNTVWVSHVIVRRYKSCPNRPWDDISVCIGSSATPPVPWRSSHSSPPLPLSNCWYFSPHQKQEKFAHLRSGYSSSPIPKLAICKMPYDEITDVAAPIGMSTSPCSAADVQCLLLGTPKIRVFLCRMLLSVPC